MTATVLVMAKAPVPGRVKTRLAADLDGRADLAASLALAALVDTVRACTEAVGAASCRLALGGRPEGIDDLRAELAGWSVVPQGDGALGRRIALALAGVPGPVVQLGMDTPQVTAAHLLDLLAGLVHDDAVLAPATDGGWWALALRDGRAGAPLDGVPLSTRSAYADTRAALRSAGLTVAGAPTLTDVDRLGDARAVAREAPATVFAQRFAEVCEEAG